MLAIHGDELAANALQLRQGHRRRRKLDRLLHILDLYLSSSFSLVVFLVGHYLREDVGRGFVELVQVVLLCSGFLLNVSKSRQLVGSAYQDCRKVRLDKLHLAVGANEGIPYLLAWRRCILFDYDEQRAVPSRHAIGLFVPEDEILKVFLVISTISVFVRQ